MKKVMILSVVALVLGAAAAQVSRTFKTCCGIVVSTVDKDYFDTPEENEDFQEDLNALYCNDDCTGSRESN